MRFVEPLESSLYYDDAGVGDPPVLLLHEWGGSSESRRHVIPRITPYPRLIVPDLRRAGRRPDFIRRPDLGRRVANLLPHATVTELADAGHFLHLQSPQVLSDAVLSFLTRT